jgi:adenine phosphoribosyltransferase
MVERVSYQLEYGENILEIHKDAINNGDKVMVVDDLLATGGTTAAVFKLIEKLGGKVIGASFIIELEFLNPREKLEGYDIFSLVQYN